MRALLLQLMPLDHRGSAVLFDGVAASEVTAEFDTVMARVVDRGELMQSPDVPDIRRRSRSSSSRWCEFPELILI